MTNLQSGCNSWSNIRWFPAAVLYLLTVVWVHGPGVEASVGVLYGDINRATTTYCPLKETATLKLLELAKSKNYYECPGNLAPEFTECCDNNRCCTISMYKQFDQSITFLVAIFIFSVSFVFSIILFFCCFCPPCPLYNSCKTKYTRDYAGCAHKMGETPLYQTMMPAESPNGITIQNGGALGERMSMDSSLKQHQQHQQSLDYQQSLDQHQLDPSAGSNLGPSQHHSHQNGRSESKLTLTGNTHYSTPSPPIGIINNLHSQYSGSCSSNGTTGTALGTFQQPQLSNSVVKLSGYRPHHHLNHLGADYDLGYFPEEVV